MDRLYFGHSVAELEQLLRETLHKPVVLAQIKEELEYRDSRRARQLLREAEGVRVGGGRRCSPKSRPPCV